MVFFFLVRTEIYTYIWINQVWDLCNIGRTRLKKTFIKQRVVSILRANNSIISRKILEKICNKKKIVSR